MNMRKILGALSLTIALVATASPSSAAIFKNCKEVNAKYPGGISKSKSAKNVGGETSYVPVVNLKVYNSVAKKLDRDKDGIACEK